MIKIFYHKKNKILLIVFTYSDTLVFDKRKLKQSESFGQGTWDLRLSLPFINHFLLKPDLEEKNISSFGFIGYAIGLDYYHKSNQYLSLLAAGLITDCCFDDLPNIFSNFMGLTNNHRFNIFAFGYGLSYSMNSWTAGMFSNKNYSANSLGLMFSSYYISENSFTVGIIYRPSFIRLNATPTVKYEHLITIDFAFRIRLYTK